MLIRIWQSKNRTVPCSFTIGRCIFFALYVISIYLLNRLVAESIVDCRTAALSPLQTAVDGGSV